MSRKSKTVSKVEVEWESDGAVKRIALYVEAESVGQFHDRMADAANELRKTLEGRAEDVS